MGDANSRFYLIYILAALSSAVKFFNTILGVLCNFCLLRENAYVYVPVFPFVVLSEGTFADPEYGALQMA